MTTHRRRRGRRAVRRRGRPAFTLIELLVVVGIIALLLSLLAPGLAQVRELARKTLCRTNLHALGRGWTMYFEQTKGRTPNMFNGRRTCPDCIAQFNFLIWCQAGAGGPCWVNAGVLYGQGLVAGEQVYVCPTIKMQSGGEWFHESKGAYWNRFQNPWPVSNHTHTSMTYSTRRMRNYDEPQLGAVDPRHADGSLKGRILEVMLWGCGVNAVEHPARFSFMSDSIHQQETALLSHVPQVNVLCLDGHVRRFEDTTEDGSILYDNGLVGWGGTAYNWLMDDVWMIIDGYHDPPVGQGRGPG